MCPALIKVVLLGVNSILDSTCFNMKFHNLHHAIHFGALLERVPRVSGTRKILSFYVVAPVNFYEMPGEQ